MSTADEIPEHAENSPSSAEGWMGCEDYINANRGLPDVQSWEAAEGTAAHWIRNECLTQGLDADGFVGHIQQNHKWSFEWTEDDAMLLQRGIDWLRSFEGMFYGEHRVDITEWVGLDSQGRRQLGTLDALIICADGLYVVDDEKWGRGVPVRAKTSKQIRIYALAAWAATGRPANARFLLSIDQPRHAGGGGKIEVTLDELLAFGEEVKRAAEATRAPNPPRTAGIGQCMWCRRKVARGGCATFDRYLLDVLGLTPEDLDNGKITMETVLTPERRANLIMHQAMIEKYLEQIRDQALEDALAGNDVPGLKPVAGRKDQDRWDDAEAAKVAVTQVLGDKGFTPKLITPTQAGKALGKDSIDFAFLESAIRRGKRKPLLVPVDDERPALITAEGMEDLD